MGGILVTAALIVRDEAANLEACFEAAAPLVDEFVVADTGSVDGTPELARELGARVIRIEWRDDFAWARNQVLPLATGTWTLILDGDDRLHGASDVRRHLETNPDVDLFALLVESECLDGAGELVAVERLWQTRLLRTAAAIRFRHRVHTIPFAPGCREGRAPGRIEHLGYRTPAARAGRVERVRRMLDLMDPADPHRLYHEIRWAASAGRHGQVVEACTRFEKLVGPLPTDAVTSLSTALLVLAQPADALQVAASGLLREPGAIDLQHAAMAAAGMGFLGTAQQIRETSDFDGFCTTLGQSPAVARALVELGVVRPEILQSSLVRAETNSTRPGRGAPPPTCSSTSALDPGDDRCRP